MIDLERVDRRIGRAVLELRAADRALRDRSDLATVQSPLEAHRPVSTRTAYLELGDLPDQPMLTAARRWVHVLTLERVTWPDRLRLAAVWNEPSIVIERPQRVTLSPRDVLARVLGEPVEGGDERGPRRSSGASPASPTRPASSPSDARRRRRCSARESRATTSG